MAYIATRFPHRFSTYIAILLSVCLGIGLWTSPVRAQDGLSADAVAVLNAINQARADAGLGPLASHPLLTQAAQNHVNDMLTNYVYGHYGSDGSSVKMRVIRTGYSQTPWVSENWVSSGSVGGAMRWWMNDYIHRVNILTPRWTEVGVGVGTRGSEMIFVTVFSAGGGAEGAVAAAPVEAQPFEEAPPPSVRIEQVQVPPEGLDYAVRPGDTLLAIGLRYGLPWERLAEVNGLSESSLLQIDQVVRIPGSGVPAEVVPPAPPVETEPYTVAAGDTLFSIAAYRNLTWQEVASVNGFGEHTVLQIGQVIQAPKAVVVEAAPVVNGDAAGLTVEMAAVAATVDVVPARDPGPDVGARKLVHTVATGDTIISIAVQYNVDWKALLDLNGLADNTLLALGQEIKLP
jgi:LysM repeat protein